MNPSQVPAAPVSMAPLKRLLDFWPTSEVHDMLYFTIMGFVLDQVQPGHKEKSSRWSRAEGAAAEDGASPTGGLSRGWTNYSHIND